MFALRSRIPSIFAASLMLMMAVGSRAENAQLPQAIKALEQQGLSVLREFEAGAGLRGFAGVAGDQPVAVYLQEDGHAIVGMRLDAEGNPVDEAVLEQLVAKPLSDQAWAQLESAAWVLDGKADAPRVVYTFSDANCPYCNRFWEAARPWVDEGKVQIRHLLVGIIKEDSPAKAAAILGAPDPSAALTENESNFDKGGIAPAPSVPDDVLQTLGNNQRLMMNMGFRGTPGIVVRQSDGLIDKYNGMPQGDTLGEVLGPR